MEKVRKIADRIDNLLRSILEQGKSLEYWQWLIFLSAMIMVRILIISLAQGLPDMETGYLVALFLQDFFYFWAVLMLIWMGMVLLARTGFRETGGLMFWGTWLVILPLFIDLLWAGRIYWSFYLLNGPRGLWQQYYSFFGHLPPAVVYFGTRISAGLVVAGTSLFVYRLSRKLLRTLGIAVFVYTSFFLVASLPSWVAFAQQLFQGKDFLSIGVGDVAGIILSPGKVWGIEHQTITGAIMFKLNLIEPVLACIVLLLFGLVSRRSGFFGEAAKGLKAGFLLPVIGLILGMLFAKPFHPEGLEPNFFGWFALGGAIVGLISGWEFNRIILDAKAKELPFDQRMLNRLAIFAFLTAFSFLSLGIKFFLFWTALQAAILVLWEKRFQLRRFPGLRYLSETGGIIFSFCFGFMMSGPEQSLELFPWLPVLWFAGGMILFFRIELAESQEAMMHFYAKSLAGAFYFLYFVAGNLIFEPERLNPWTLILGVGAYGTWLGESRTKSIWLRILFGLFLLMTFGLA